MKKLIQSLQEIKSSKLGSVLFIGAGKGDLLPTLRRLDAEQLLLCEPNPDNFHVLERLVDSTKHEEIFPCAAVTTDVQIIDLHILSNTRYSSTAIPEKILGLRPNLKIEKSLSVPTRQLRHLVQQHIPAANQGNVLILNAQGANHALLHGIPINHLYSFEWLLVSGMQIHDAYAGDRSLEETTQFLKDVGYEMWMNDQEVIHPNAVALFKRHPLVAKVLELEQKNAAFAQRLEKVNFESTDLAAQLNHAQQSKSQLEQQLAERQSQIDNLTQSRDEQAQLANTRATQIEALNQAKASAEKLAAERQTQVQQISQERDEHAKQLGESKTQLAQIQQAKAQLDQQLKERQSQIESLTQSRDEQAQLASTRATQIEALNQAKANAEKLAAERQTQVQQISQERDEHAKQLGESKTQLTQTQQAKAQLDQQLKERQSQIENLTKSRDEQVQKVQQHAQRLAQLEAERTEMDARQQLLSEEMIRAEAQIDLIKDVLLREPGL